MTSLKIIILSKFGKEKRRKHIENMERELGLSFEETYVNGNRVEVIKTEVIDRKQIYKRINRIFGKSGYCIDKVGTSGFVRSFQGKVVGVVFLYWDDVTVYVDCLSRELFSSPVMETLEKNGFVVKINELGYFRREPYVY